jgi:hypothetical protein
MGILFAFGSTKAHLRTLDIGKGLDTHCSIDKTLKDIDCAAPLVIKMYASTISGLIIGLPLQPDYSIRPTPLASKF